MMNKREKKSRIKLALRSFTRRRELRMKGKIENEEVRIKNEGEEKIINKNNEKVFQKNNSGYFDS